MSRKVVTLENVSKKFRRGELYDSLRDLVPALLSRFAARGDALRDDRDFWAIQDIDLEIGEGEAVAIIGPNGAGKSTILKLLSRVMKPTRGRISVDGRLSALIEVGAGFHPDLTGRENVFLNGTILGMSRGEIRSKFDEIVEFAGLEEFIDTPVKRYSSGMYARLGFAVAAHVDPEVLIVDEVLSVGDYVFQNRCIERMQAIRNSGATVLFVSHNLHAVSNLCPRAVLLERGKVVADGDSSEVIRTYLDRSQESRFRHEGAEGRITGVTLRGPDGPTVKFESGAKAWLDIEFEAVTRLERVAVAIEVCDEANYRIFDVSTERLGMPTRTMEPGERGRVTFEFDLHLGRGTFHFGAYLFRSDIPKHFDHWFPCTTCLVHPQENLRGVVNLYPRVAEATGDPGS